MGPLALFERRRVARLARLRRHDPFGPGRVGQTDRCKGNSGESRRPPAVDHAINASSASSAS